MSQTLKAVKRVSSSVWSVHGMNPSAYTLGGTNTYLVSSSSLLSSPPPPHHHHHHRHHHHHHHHYHHHHRRPHHHHHYHDHTTTKVGTGAKRILIDAGEGKAGYLSNLERAMQLSGAKDIEAIIRTLSCLLPLIDRCVSLHFVGYS
jgi:hypothetical protein